MLLTDKSFAWREDFFTGGRGGNKENRKGEKTQWAQRRQDSQRSLPTFPLISFAALCVLAFFTLNPILEISLLPLFPPVK
jgi:hypothetical protein